VSDFALREQTRSLPSPTVNAFKNLLWIFPIAAALAFPMALSSAEAEAEKTIAEAESAVAAPATNAVTTDPQLLRQFLLLQEQLRETQRAVEQAREQAKSDARRAEELMAARLNLIEQTFNAQRHNEMENLQRSARTLFIIVGVVAALGLGAVLFAGVVQVRAMTRLADVSQQLRAALPAPGAGPALLGNGQPIEASNAQLFGAIDKLEARLQAMEQAGGGSGQNGLVALPQASGTAAITTLLAKGQTLLNLNKPEEALELFNDALAVEPRHVEAWIKKGTALERLQRIDEAIEAYDQAISADNSTATAYLFKAGVFNRQKKYAEALQCYEKALSVQQKARVPQTAQG
jgi:tetratricopeptide (TPR) repeat protein